MGGEAGWCGQEVWGRGAAVCWCGRETQRPRGTRAGLPRRALSAGPGLWAGEGGRGSPAAREPGVSWSGGPPSTVRRWVPPQRRWGSGSSPDASTSLGACGPGGGKRRRRPPGTAWSRHPGSRLRASSGPWYLLPRPQLPGRPFSPFRAQPRTREASRRARRTAQPCTAPFSRRGTALHKDRASVSDPQGQTKATSL